MEEKGREGAGKRSPFFPAGRVLEFAQGMSFSHGSAVVATDVGSGCLAGDQGGRNRSPAYFLSQLPRELKPKLKEETGEV